MKLLIWTLLQPVGLMLLGALLALVLAWRQHAKLSLRVLLLVWLVAGIVLSTPLVGRMLGAWVVGLTPEPAVLSHQSRPALVVLTGGIRQQASLGWLPRPESVRRALLGLELYGQISGQGPLIVSGGYTHGPLNPSEARVAANFMDALRAERLPIVLEDISTNTVESAREVRKMADVQGFNTVFLVTDELHMPRAAGVFRRAGFNVVPVPVLTQPAGRGLRDLVPGLEGLALTHGATYEAFGLFSYWLKGFLTLSNEHGVAQ
jgi:uncharacterized SAM-binding protein YcdF (DUF218 family)